MTKTHLLDQFRRDPCGVGPRFIGCNIERPVLFVNPSEDTQVGPEACPCSFTSVAMDSAMTIPMVIARPCAHPVGHRGMVRMATSIALPCIGLEECATRGHVISHQVLAGSPVCMITAPPALLSRVPRDHTANRWPIVRRGAVPLPLIGAPPGRIRRVRVRGACCPSRARACLQSMRASRAKWAHSAESDSGPEPLLQLAARSRFHGLLG
jgi:hypothetical protein